MAQDVPQEPSHDAGGKNLAKPAHAAGSSQSRRCNQKPRAADREQASAKKEVEATVTRILLTLKHEYAKKKKSEESQRRSNGELEPHQNPTAHARPRRETRRAPSLLNPSLPRGKFGLVPGVRIGADLEQGTD